MLKMVYKDPVGHNVLVKLQKVEATTKSGIITALATDKQQRAVDFATVVKLGSQAYKGFHDGTSWVNEGDLVAIKRYSGAVNDLTNHGDIYRIILDDDIVATVEEVESNE